MALELIYTLAPQGLRPGARGFCTVACTVDMTGPMVTTLEGLSGYAYPPQISSPEAAKNPHRFAHLRPTIGGRQYSVLSHVCAAGTNYQGRKNVLAHHVLLTQETEYASAGPAWVMMQPGVLSISGPENPGNSPRQK